MRSLFDTFEIRSVYESGGNISEYIRGLEDASSNSSANVLYSYDFQAGSYTELARRPERSSFVASFAEKLAAVIEEQEASSLLDAGTGEATSLAPTLQQISDPPEVWAFDISLSRLLYARRNLEEAQQQVNLFVADLERIPLSDSSVDVALTVHALEPNGGREADLLAELIRVAQRRLVLVEPSWEFASEEQRERMSRHRYVRNLPGHLEALGARVTQHEPWGLDVNPLNAAALIVAEMPLRDGEAPPRFVSPISRMELVSRGDLLWCPEDGFAWPSVLGIPCLLAEYAILATALDRFG